MLAPLPTMVTMTPVWTSELYGTPDGTKLGAHELVDAVLLERQLGTLVDAPPRSHAPNPGARASPRMSPARGGAAGEVRERHKKQSGTSSRRRTGGGGYRRQRRPWSSIEGDNESRRLFVEWQYIMPCMLILLNDVSIFAILSSQSCVYGYCIS